MGSGEAGLVFRESGLDLLSGKNEGNEHGLAASAVVGRKASQSIAAVDQLFNVQEQDLILRHWEGIEMDWEFPVAECERAIEGRARKKKGRDRIAALLQLIVLRVGYGTVPSAAAAGQLLLNENQPAFAGL